MSGWLEDSTYALRQVRKNPKLLAHYRRNAMKRDFSWEQTCEQFVNLYEKTVNKRI